MLADDMIQWPSDPYRLLGVPRGSSPQEVRRAYVRLIRRFRADRFPEHFQRIRAAYEQINQAQDGPATVGRRVPVDRHATAPLRHFSSTPVASPQPSTENAPDLRASRFSSTKKSSRPNDDSMGKSVYQLWKLALDGCPEESYTALLSRLNRNDDPAEVCIRLYWLLAAMPALDRSRARCDWLLEALVNSQLTGSAVELYARELRHDPELALDVYGSRLLECTAQPADLLRILGIRWCAFSNLKRPADIVTDLENIRPKIPSSQTDTWVWTLMLALDHLAWFANSQDVFRSLHAELEETGQSHGRFYSELARVDTLVEVSAGWREIPPNDLLAVYWYDLVPFSWREEERSVRRAVRRMIRRMGMEPQQAFTELQWIKSKSESVFHYIGSLVLDHSKRSMPESRTCASGDLERSMQRFLHLRGDSAPSALGLALEFCLQEDVLPDELEQRSERIGRLLEEKLGTSRNLPFPVTPIFRDDGSLHYIYAAWRQAWETG